MSIFAKRSAMVAMGGVMYVSVSVLVYKYMTVGSEEVEQVQNEISSRANNFSFVHNPLRNQTFQTVAHCYDEQIGRDEKVMGITILRWMLLKYHAKGVVLEVGAGTGRNIDYYPRWVERVVLTDTSDQMLSHAKLKLQQKDRKHEKFATMEADAANLQQYFPDHCFDTVVDTFGLCSYDDPVRVLKEMARVCKPEGKILLLEHGRSKVWDALSRYLDKHAERHAKNWGCVWNRDLDQMVQEAGLTIDRMDTWHFGTTYYVVCRPSSRDKE